MFFNILNLRIFLRRYNMKLFLDDVNKMKVSVTPQIDYRFFCLTLLYSFK